MAIRIKVELVDFEEAKTDGFVYGKDLGRRHGNSVYVELGFETEYRPSYQDNSKTKYRCFINSVVRYAFSDEMADEGQFYSETDPSTVIIYN